jgi:hypothetical protein
MDAIQAPTGRARGCKDLDVLNIQTRLAPGGGMEIARAHGGDVRDRSSLGVSPRGFGLPPQIGSPKRVSV